jgi:hypothetical protein
MPARPNIATSTQKESTRPTTVKAKAPISRPMMRMTRAPSQSTRNPAGVCSAAVMTLNAASARPISV